MSCQAAMDDQEKQSPVHAYAAPAVPGVCNILKGCAAKPNFRPLLDGDSGKKALINLTGVSNNYRIFTAYIAVVVNGKVNLRN